MDTIEIVAVVLGAVLAVAVPFLGVKWSRTKKVIKAISAAVQDDSVTPAEIRNIIAAFLGK
ncbi:unnamed protein product [marine sediment metagenome]|uniref:Uncharacterized protein n=1 Tax=marine sediment metagenome TaxID=412755 RepID=X0TFU1_9ZZZZ